MIRASKGHKKVRPVQEDHSEEDDEVIDPRYYFDLDLGLLTILVLLETCMEGLESINIASLTKRHCWPEQDIPERANDHRCRCLEDFALCQAIQIVQDLKLGNVQSITIIDLEKVVVAMLRKVRDIASDDDQFEELLGHYAYSMVDAVRQVGNIADEQWKARILSQHGRGTADWRSPHYRVSLEEVKHDLVSELVADAPEQFELMVDS